MRHYKQRLVSFARARWGDRQSHRRFGIEIAGWFRSQKIIIWIVRQGRSNSDALLFRLPKVPPASCCMRSPKPTARKLSSARFLIIVDLRPIDVPGSETFFNLIQFREQKNNLRKQKPSFRCAAAHTKPSCRCKTIGLQIPRSQIPVVPIPARV